MSEEINHNVSEFYSYPVYPEPIQSRPVHPGVLLDVLRKAQQVGKQGLVVFDIDSTIYDSRPREVRILREFGESHGIPILTKFRPDHIRDRSLTRSMMNCGLSKEEAESLDQTVREFWFGRFLTNEYCLEDRPIPGAVAFLNEVKKTQACIAYCTGRPKDEMEEGTILSLQRDSFPVPDHGQVSLFMKPKLHMSDDESKQLFYKELKSKQPVIAAFDNEPLHINGYQQTFPNAICVHLLTEESGRGISVLPSILSIRDFMY